MVNTKEHNIASFITWHRSWGVDEVLSVLPQAPRGNTPLGDVKSLTKLGNTSAVLEKHLPCPDSKDLNLASCDSLEALASLVNAFEGCALKRSALNTVFSDGFPQAHVMIVGEAPGADEDQQGKPFVGLSGQLLDKIFSTIGLSRHVKDPEKSLYISNIIPWRPPGNRQPTIEETALCLPFIERHISLIRPRCLILVGGTACKALLKENRGITRVRGQWLSYANPYLEQPIKAFALYHPAYLLRSPGQKRQTWQDLLRLKQALS